MQRTTVLEQMKNTIPVSEFRRLLALGKTESYWLLKKGQIRTIMICGKMRVCLDSFNEWYENQTHYSRVDGIPPGNKLKQNSYSVQDVAAMLNVNKDTVYERIKNHEFETFQYEHITRITRESFDKWYKSQNKLRLSEDRRHDDKRRKFSYSQPQIARILGVNRNTVYAIVKREAFECITVAGQTRVMRSSFEKWLDSRDIIRKPEPKAVPHEEPETKLADKPFFTVQELITDLGISKNTIYRLLQNGTINSVRKRSGYLITREDALKIEKEVHNHGNHNPEEEYLLRDL